MNNCEILISISLGDNFPLKDEFLLSKDCKAHCILEAKFNDELLQSDPIEIDSKNPELATELGFRVNKKDFHQFRTERKSIKLQCFVEYSTLTERHFIGYIVLHLRDAQDYTIEPKYKWVVLLNPKYKGSSSKRPQLYLALMVNKLNETSNNLCLSETNDSLETSSSISENQFTRSIKKEGNNKNIFTDSMMTIDFCTNLMIDIMDQYVYIWNKNICDKDDCHQVFTIHIHLNRPKNLNNLFNEPLDENYNDKKYFFRYVLFGKQIKTNYFTDLKDSKDFRLHKYSVNLKTFNKTMLQEYFESYPTIEIQFCSVDNELIGFVTINLLKLFQQTNAFINGNFVVVPEEESVYVKDPFPVINLRLFLLNQSKNDETFLDRPIDYINHYYIAIDLRTIKLSTANSETYPILFQPFYLQFSYAFFGATEPIKTYPSIKFSMENPDQEITIPHGFCGFNLATTYEKLCYTFENLPLIIQLILEQDNTLLGTSEINLKCLLNKSCDDDALEDLNDNFINVSTCVYDELNDQICEIQVIMFIQELFDSINDENDSSRSKKIQFTNNNSSKMNRFETKSIPNLSENLKVSNKPANGGEFQDQQQEKLPDKNESNVVNIEKIIEKEKELQVLFKKLNEREKNLYEKEKMFELKQKAFDEKLANYDPDMETTLQEVRNDYENQINQLRNKMHLLEQDKFKYQEKNYQLERKMKEKNTKIRELESKLFELTQINRRKQQQQQQQQSLMTSSVDANSNNGRKIIITREFEEAMNDQTTSKISKPSPLSSSNLPVRSKSISRPNSASLHNQ